MSRLFLAGIFPLLIFVVTGCDHAMPDVKLPTPEVIVAHPTLQTVTTTFDFTGRTVAVESVQIQARVSGYLGKPLFQDGDEVKAKQPLFDIDDRPYKAARDQVVANIALYEAQLKLAETELKRSSTLKQKGVVTQEELDKAIRTRDVAQAQVEAAQAELEAKDLDLAFTKIHSPIDGRIDKTNVTEGNLVTANQTLLTNIVSLKPIYVYFNVEEPVWLKVQEMRREGKLKPRKDDHPEILVGLGSGTTYPYQGEIDFVGNKVDPSTGTIPVRGVIANEDESLVPGLFVRVRVTLGNPREAIMIPEVAIGSSQGQKYVYVVNEKNIADKRDITLGDRRGKFRVVESGLSTSDTIVVDGLLRIRPGIEVNPKPQDPANAPKPEADETPMHSLPKPAAKKAKSDKANAEESEPSPQRKSSVNELPDTTPSELPTRPAPRERPSKRTIETLPEETKSGEGASG